MKSYVKEIMKKKGITLRQLMAETGLANKTVLNARDDIKILTCGLGTLETIARALGVSVKDLFEEEP